VCGTFGVLCFRPRFSSPRPGVVGPVRHPPFRAGIGYRQHYAARARLGMIRWAGRGATPARLSLGASSLSGASGPSLRTWVPPRAFCRGAGAADRRSATQARAIARSAVRPGVCARWSCEGERSLAKGIMVRTHTQVGCARMVHGLCDEESWRCPPQRQEPAGLPPDSSRGGRQHHAGDSLIYSQYRHAVNALDVAVRQASASIGCSSLSRHGCK
jgi:hypothetical protein